MSVHDLTFEVVSTGETIYDPLTLVTTGSTVLRVLNLGADDLTDLGMFVVAATTLGDVDNPADFPPHTDYQDLLTWGEAVDVGLAAQGGLKLTLPQNTGPDLISYITRTKGDRKGNKITFKNLIAGSSATFTLDLETPPGVSSRRLFIDLKLE
jgi:hypothetical protein